MARLGASLETVYSTANAVGCRKGYWKSNAVLVLSLRDSDREGRADPRRCSDRASLYLAEFTKKTGYFERSLVFGQRARRMGVRVGSRSHSAGRIPAVVGPDADGHGRRGATVLRHGRSGFSGDEVWGVFAISVLRAGDVVGAAKILSMCGSGTAPDFFFAWLWWRRVRRRARRSGLSRIDGNDQLRGRGSSAKQRAKIRR